LFKTVDIEVGLIASFNNRNQWIIRQIIAPSVFIFCALTSGTRLLAKSLTNGSFVPEVGTDRSSIPDFHGDLCLVDRHRERIKIETQTSSSITDILTVPEGFHFVGRDSERGYKKSLFGGIFCEGIMKIFCEILEKITHIHNLFSCHSLN
jgi:hypothetical protein